MKKYWISIFTLITPKPPNIHLNLNTYIGRKLSQFKLQIRIRKANVSLTFFIVFV